VEKSIDRMRERKPGGGSVKRGGGGKGSGSNYSGTRVRKAGTPVPSSLDSQITYLGLGSLIDDVEAGDDKLTREQPEPVAREDPSDLVLRGTQGRLRGVEGAPHHVEGVSSSHIFIVIPTAGGGASQPRHNRGSRPPGG